MRRKNNHTNPSTTLMKPGKKGELPGYPLYPAKEDIFSKSTEEKNIDPEDTSQNKEPEKDISEDMSGSDLDVPGSELDDEQERAGNEDEENNYYSLGGEGHDD